jgi:hypothetical protein
VAVATNLNMKRGIVLAALGVLALSPGVAGADFDFQYAGHSYLVVTTPRRWVQAAADATSRQQYGVAGALARIDDQPENDAIFSQLLAHIPSGDFSRTVAPDGGGGAYVWIGASDRVAEGTWLWDGDNDGSGDQFWSGSNSGHAVGGRYSNWGRTNNRQNEPDNYNGSQDTAGISLNGWPLGVRGQWNDLNENNNLYSLIEFSAVPEPSTLWLIGTGTLVLTTWWRVSHRRR